MAILLGNGATTIALDEALLWTDEWSWAPVRQVVERSLTGGLLVDVQGMAGGRPITLAGVVPDRAWVRRDAIAQMAAWAAVPGQVMTLTLRGEAHQVMWRHQDGVVIEAEAVMPTTEVAADDDYRVTLRFFEV